MSEPGDLMDLMREAYRRLPTISARMHSWMHIERNERAMEVAGQHFAPGPVTGPHGHNRSGPPEYESWDRLVIDPRRGAFRFEHRDSWNRSQKFVSDGETTWTRNFRGDVIATLAEPDHPNLVPGRAMIVLDPSWLVDYDITSYTNDWHNVRNVVRMCAKVSSGRTTQLRLDIYATDVKVVVDARLGFLHRLTEFVDGQPYQRFDVTDVVLDPSSTQRSSSLIECSGTPISERWLICQPIQLR